MLVLRVPLADDIVVYGAPMNAALLPYSYSPAGCAAPPMTWIRPFTWIALAELVRQEGMPALDPHRSAGHIPCLVAGGTHIVAETWMLSGEPCNVFQPKFICSLVLCKLRARVIFRHWRFLGCLIYKCETRQVFWWCEEFFLCHGMEREYEYPKDLPFVFRVKPCGWPCPPRQRQLKPSHILMRRIRLSFCKMTGIRQMGIHTGDLLACLKARILALPDFSGANLTAGISVGADLWETVSIKSPGRKTVRSAETQEIQLVVRPGM